jgi:hypothetical protein
MLGDFFTQTHLVTLNCQLRLKDVVDSAYPLPLIAFNLIQTCSDDAKV